MSEIKARLLTFS